MLILCLSNFEEKYITLIRMPSCCCPLLPTETEQINRRGVDRPFAESKLLLSEAIAVTVSRMHVFGATMPQYTFQEMFEIKQTTLGSKKNTQNLGPLVQLFSPLKTEN